MIYQTDYSTRIIYSNQEISLCNNYNFISPFLSLAIQCILQSITEQAQRIKTLHQDYSILLDHIAEGEGIVIIDGRHRSHHLTLLQFLVLECHPPVCLIAIVSQSALDHVQGYSDYVSGHEWGAVVGACGVAIVPGLAVVDGPAVDSIRKGFFEIGNGGTANSNLDELSLVDKDFKIVSSSLGEYLRAHGGLKPIALCGLGPEAFGIEFDLVTGLVDVPAKEGQMIGGGTGIEAFGSIDHDLLVVLFLLAAHQELNIIRILQSCTRKGVENGSNGRVEEYQDLFFDNFAYFSRSLRSLRYLLSEVGLKILRLVKDNFMSIQLLKIQINNFIAFHLSIQNLFSSQLKIIKQLMNLFDLLVQGHHSKDKYLSNQTSIHSLLPQSKELCSFKVEELSANQIDESREVVISSIRAVKVHLQDEQDNDTQMVEESTFIESPDVNADKEGYHSKQKESINGQAGTRYQSLRTTFAKRLHFYNFIEEMLNDKITKICILNSMIYGPFNYFFLWSCHLPCLSEIKKNGPQDDRIAIISMFSEIMNHLLQKFCNKDKQKVIQRIFKTKYSINGFQRFGNNFIKAGQVIHLCRKQFENDRVSQSIGSPTYLNNEDISYILKYIKMKERILL